MSQTPQTGQMDQSYSPPSNAGNVATGYPAGSTGADPGQTQITGAGADPNLGTHSTTQVDQIQFGNFQALSWPASKEDILQQAGSLPPEQQQFLGRLPDDTYSSIEQVQTACRQLQAA